MERRLTIMAGLSLGLAIMLGASFAFSLPVPATDLAQGKGYISGSGVARGDVDLNGHDLITDADGDTRLECSVDDVVDVYVNGAKDFSFAANAFTAEAGSTITGPKIYECSGACPVWDHAPDVGIAGVLEVNGISYFDERVAAAFTDASGLADGSRVFSFTTTGTHDPAGELTSVYGAYNRTVATNGTFTVQGVEGVARSQSADEAGTFRGVYGRTYIDTATEPTATARTSVGVEASARASYSGGPEVTAEAGTAFCGERIWMAPYFSAASVNNVNNFWGLWIYGEHATQRNADAAIRIGDAGGGFTADLNLQHGTKITNDVAGDLIIQGDGAANDEDLKLDLETVADTVGISSSTGVTTIDTGSIALACTGLDASDGNLTNVGDLDVDTVSADGTSWSAVDLTTVQGTAPVTDAAPATISIHPADAYAQATVNTAGASVRNCPGIGRRLVTVTDKANSAGDTLTFTVDGASTVLTAGTSWVCAAAADNAECALNLKNAATIPAGLTASCVDGTCSTAVVYFTPAVSTVCTFSTPVIADAGGGGAFGTATGGADGQYLFPDGSAAAPGLAFIDDPDTGVRRTAANTWAIVAGTNTMMSFSTTATTLSTGPLNANGQRIYDSTAVLVLGAPGTTSHSLVSNDVLVGGAIEANGTLWADNGARIGSELQVTNYASFYGGSDDGLRISPTMTDGLGNSNIIFTSFANYLKDHDHDTPSAQTTVFWHSATDPDTDNTQWLSIYRDVNNGVIATGSGDILLDPAGNDVLLTHSGSNTNSDTLKLQANNAGTVDTATIQAIYGADPYLRLSAPNDAGTATAMLDLHDTVAVIGTGTADVDYALQLNGETSDGTLTWMEDESQFDVGAASFACTAADLGDGNLTNVGTIAADSINADGTTVDYNDVNIIELAQEDVGATCDKDMVRIDTGGATVELCVCTATNTWKCAALAAGPAD